MKLLHILSALHIAAASAVTQNKVNYGGFKVYRVHDVVGEDAKEAFTICYQLDAFNKAVGDRKITVMHEDLGASIARESASITHAASTDRTSSWFDAYHAFADHQQYLESLQAKYPANAQVVSSGFSGQGRNMTGIHLFGKDGPGKNPAVVFHGTVHAREWITTMVTEWIADVLLAGYATDPKLAKYLDKYDFFIFPIVNPDGYEYSWTTDRMWRKNRQKTPGSFCTGTDINRNWPYKWNATTGSSDDACAEDYRGQAPGDTPEMQGITNFLLKIKAAQGVSLYVDFHSYSQLWMYPYAYTCDALPENVSEYDRLSKGAVKAIQKVHGTKFTEGSTCSIIYTASGDSVDYNADVVGAKMSLAIELRDLGKYGFILPPNQIKPSGEEMFAGIAYLLDNM